MKKKTSLYGFRGCIPDILRYQFITKFWLAILAGMLRLARGAVLWTSDRSALSSGDIPFLMTSVQGWITIILGLFLLVVYMVFDINAMVLLSEKVLHNRPIRVREIIKEAFRSLKYFRHPLGLVLVIYVAFLLPLAGVGLGITLTENFYVPDFITSVIEANRLYNTLYTIALLFLFVLSIHYLFLFHFILLNDEPVTKAIRSAGTLMRAKWKTFFKDYLKYLIGCILVGIVIVLLSAFILLGIAGFIPTDSELKFRFLMVFISFAVLTIAEVYLLLFVPFQFIKLTSLFEIYTGKSTGEMLYPPKRKHPFMVLVSLFIIVFLIIAGYGGAFAFDDFFPELGATEIIAHRGGGIMGTENTVNGLEEAIKYHAHASEIDVQRTKDGYYILNHDTTFQRLAGVDRKVSDMTLKEVQELTLSNTYPLMTNEQKPAAFEEILDAAKGRIHLYIELKGDTADEQMADDLWKIVTDRRMEDDVTFISLDYSLIMYIEETYPECTTGYLCYAAFGEVEDLAADELVLEEEMATPANIEAIHGAGKKVGVWTVNKQISMLRFYSRNVDAIITDDVENAVGVRDALLIEPDIYAKEYKDMMRVILHTIFVWWP